MLNVASGLVNRKSMMSKTQQDRSRERDQRSNITRNNNNSTYNNKSSAKAKKWSTCKEKGDSRSKIEMRIDSNLQIHNSRPAYKKRSTTEKGRAVHSVLSEEMQKDG
jgi:hypothetical protein